MAGEWSEVAVSDLAGLSGGFAFKSGDYSPSGRFILRTLNISDDCSISHEDAVYIPEELCQQYQRFELQAGDTLFVMVGATLGKVGYVREKDLPALLNQNMWLIRAKQGLSDSRFVHYAFRHAVKASLGWASGSARDFVRRDDYRKLLIPTPPLPEQRAIARILGTLDDKIELNRRMNETLEAMARALFKSWFVDFDPVRAKAEGRDTGLPRHIAELFPDSFEDSELGKVPRGWKVRHLGDIAENPKRTMRADRIPPSTPYIALEHMPKCCISLSEWQSSDGLASNKFEFKRGEILFGKLRPYFHKVGVAPIDGVCSTDIVVVAPRKPIWFGFVLGHVSSTAFVEYTNTGSTGTRMPRTSWSEMARYRLAIPPASVAGLFNEHVRESVVRIIAGIHESHTLAILRDELLPRLVSGTLRISPPEHASR